MMDLYDEKIAHLEDKLKVWSEQVGRLVEDGWRHSLSLGNAQRKLVDVEGEVQQLKQPMDQIQAKVGRSRLEVAELLIESEKESGDRLVETAGASTFLPASLLSYWYTGEW